MRPEKSYRLTMSANKSPATIVFFGTPEFAAKTLGTLLDEGYLIAMVVTKADAPSGRRHKLTPSPIKTLAATHHIPVLQPSKLSDIELHIKSLNPIIGVVVAYGKIIPQSVIDLFPLGIINIHASLLPKYRGASPIEACLLNGDTETGISLMQIDASLDTGPVYAQERIQILSNDNRITLYDKLATLGAHSISKHLNNIITHDLKPRPQSLLIGPTSTTKLVLKTNGVINWQQSASTINNSIRAYLGWPGSQATILGREVIITKATNLDVISNHSIGTSFINDRQLFVACANSTLQIDSLRPSGKNEMESSAFIAGLHL